MKLSSDKQKEYLEEVRREMPKTKHFTTMLKAFVTGGTICCIGQAFTYLYQYVLPGYDEKTIAGFTTITMILITCILTGFGIYDKIGSFGGAGSIVPITGFANSIVSPAMEFKTEGYIYGLAAKMFVIAGPIIVFGVASSVLVGLIYFVIYSNIL